MVTSLCEIEDSFGREGLIQEVELKQLAEQIQTLGIFVTMGLFR